MSKLDDFLSKERGDPLHSNSAHAIFVLAMFALLGLVVFMGYAL